MKIGIFDSGFGGILTLRDIHTLLPQYDYVYLGDNARAPYGDRSQDRIYEFTQQGVEFLFSKNCTLVILACNTASSQALRRLQQEWLPTHYPDRHILGIIIPITESVAARKTRKPKKIGLIGTRATVASDAYTRELEKQTGQPVSIVQQACPLLVPFIEEGWENTAPAIMVLKKYLRALKEKQVSILILACTHYPAIKKKIAGIMGRSALVLDPGPIVAESLKRYLARHPEIESALSKNTTIFFYTTDVSDRIRALAQKFWKKPLTLESIHLE